MRKIIFTLTAIFIFINLLAQEEKRLALVIGNANYDKGELKNPVNDARLIASTLDSLDFDVILETDLDKGKFMKKVVEFGNKRGDYDVGFVYYAGHGVQINGENYLLPTNQNFDEEWKIEEYAINVNRIMKYLTAVSDQVNILILDACRNNPWEGSFRSVSVGDQGGLAKMQAPTGSLIAFSTGPGRVAADGDGENSVYTTSLSKNMLIEDTSIDQVFRNVRAEVLAETGGMQRPVEATQLTGQTFYLNPVDLTKTIIKAKDLIKNEKFLDALSIIDIALEKNKSNITLLEQKFECYYGIGRFKEAYEITKTISSIENSSENFANKARAQAKLGNSKKAMEYWLQASKINNKFFVEYALTTWEYSKNYENTIKLFEQTKNENKTANYYFKLGYVQYHNGKDIDDPEMVNQAINNFEISEKQSDFHEITEENFISFIEKYSFALSEVGRVNDAINLIERYKKFEKISGEFDIQKAAIYGDSKEFEKAIIAAKNYLKYPKDNHGTTYSILGQASEYLENWDEAIDYYSQALRLLPNDNEIYFRRGWSFSQINKYSEALSDYFQVLELNKKYDQRVYLNISNIYISHIKRYDEALRILNKGIDNFPEYAALHLNRSIVNENLNRIDDAVKDISKAINLDERPYFYARRGDLYNLRLGYYEKARKDFSRSIELGSYYAQVQKIFLEFTLLNITEAKKDLDYLNDNYKDDWFGNYLLFIYYTQPNYNYEESLFSYNKITEEIQMPDWFSEQDGLSFVYWVRSILEFKAGNIVDSRLFINKALEINDEYPAFHYNLYRIKEKENKFLALNELNTAIDKIERLYHDDNAIIEIETYKEIFFGEFYRLRAKLFIDFGEIDLAFEDYNKFQSYYDKNIETVSKNLKDSANKILEDFDLMLKPHRKKSD